MLTPLPQFLTTVTLRAVVTLDADRTHFKQEKVDLGGDSDRLSAMLHSNTALAIAVLKAVPAGDLEKIIKVPWGDYTISEVMVTRIGICPTMKARSMQSRHYLRGTNAKPPLPAVSRRLNPRSSGRKSREARHNLV